MSENYSWPVWSKTNYSACLLPSEYFKEDLVESNIIEVRIFAFSIQFKTTFHFQRFVLPFKASLEIHHNHYQ